MSGFLLDTSILLRWINSSDPQHQLIVAGLTRLGDAGETIWIAQQNVVVFWSVATRSVYVNGLGLAPADAEHAAGRIEAAFPMLDKTPGLYREWRCLVAACSVSGRQVHDARLAAIMLVHGVQQILTLNEVDFHRYPGIAPRHPQSI